MERKKKLRLFQTILLIVGIIIIFIIYTDKGLFLNKKINQKTTTLIENKTTGKKENIFYNIEYSGLDLAGNRYIIKSKEATTNASNQEIINMKFVESFFYFKDDTVLKVKSDYGTYNNKTLDMFFNSNVKANYQNSVLFAENAEYSNSENFLSISGKVKIEDFKGTMFADKLLFDIKKYKLNITSFNDDKINANLNLK
ncbi:LPS export ABC transporter periplasmic protein LptC [Candidatus Pelagibacter bacterium]|nr:LPS export ABC transporter periplasmic protein LptC [Candidatus Pelagibacter bacterium]